MSMKQIILSYQKNIRDLGGYVGFGGKKVKFGKIYRGGHLHRVSLPDIIKINKLHLTDIIDLRGVKEFNVHHDYNFKGVTFHNIPPMIEEVKKGQQKYEDSNLLWFLGDDEGFEHMLLVYRDITTSPFGIEAYKKLFALLKDRNKTFYFHCSQGKDRAGMAAYLFLIALGVSEEDARKDYLLSNEAMELKIKELKKLLGEEDYFDEQYERSLRDVFTAKEEYLDAALDAIKEKYGSVLNYLKEALDVDVDEFRSIYLE